MKLQQHNNALETNAISESQEFGIGDPSVIIGILRNNMYAYKIRSMCQEIICNGRDAMREVGKGNEFEITVPTRLSPVFKVRDFGPGVSPDRMANVFIKFGSSTKRNDNGQTGGFGLGAKSPFSYTDSFTITTFIDGIKRSYVAHTGTNNQGRLDLVSTDATTEANGTEIQVVVKAHDVEEFRNSVFRAVYFWKDRPIIKGELQTPELISGHVVSDLVEVVEVERGFQGTGLELRDGLLYEGETPFPSELSDRILKFKDAGLPYAPLIKFWDNLKKNPSFNARKMMFAFLEHNGIPLTQNGCFIAYRGVTEDFKDKHTRTFNNAPGSICEMPRDLVDDNPNNTCSAGLHVACYAYAKDFAAGGKLVEVKVNPMDVVAVPTDYNGTKMRTCKFEVVCECAEELNKLVYDEPVLGDTLDEDNGDTLEDGECPECGHMNDEDANFCSECGTGLDND